MGNEASKEEKVLMGLVATKVTKAPQVMQEIPERTDKPVLKVN